MINATAMVSCIGIITPRRALRYFHTGFIPEHSTTVGGEGNIGAAVVNDRGVCKP